MDGVRGVGARILSAEGIRVGVLGDVPETSKGKGGTAGLSERLDALLLCTEFDRERVGVGVGVYIGSGSFFTCGRNCGGRPFVLGFSTRRSSSRKRKSIPYSSRNYVFQVVS